MPRTRTLEQQRDHVNGLRRKLDKMYGSFVPPTTYAEVSRNWNNALARLEEMEEAKGTESHLTADGDSVRGKAPAGGGLNDAQLP